MAVILILALLGVGFVVSDELGVNPLHELGVDTDFLRRDDDLQRRSDPDCAHQRSAPLPPSAYLAGNQRGCDGGSERVQLTRAGDDYLCRLRADSAGPGSAAAHRPGS